MGNCVQAQLDEIEQKEVMIKVKYTDLKVKKGNTVYRYECKTAEWNFYLGRYYPKAELLSITEHLN